MNPSLLIPQPIAPSMQLRAPSRTSRQRSNPQLLTTPCSPELSTPSAAASRRDLPSPYSSSQHAGPEPAQSPLDLTNSLDPALGQPRARAPFPPPRAPREAGSLTLSCTFRRCRRLLPCQARSSLLLSSRLKIAPHQPRAAALRQHAGSATPAAASPAITSAAARPSSAAAPSSRARSPSPANPAAAPLPELLRALPLPATAVAAHIAGEPRRHRHPISPLSLPSFLSPPFLL